MHVVFERPPLSRRPRRPVPPGTHPPKLCPGVPCIRVSGKGGRTSHTDPFLLPLGTPPPAIRPHAPRIPQGFDLWTLGCTVLQLFARRSLSLSLSLLLSPRLTSWARSASRRILRMHLCRFITPTPQSVHHTERWSTNHMHSQSRSGQSRLDCT
jgi:hypothetical protein